MWTRINPGAIDSISTSGTVLSASVSFCIYYRNRSVGFSPSSASASFIALPRFHRQPGANKSSSPSRSSKFVSYDFYPGLSDNPGSCLIQLADTLICFEHNILASMVVPRKSSFAFADCSLKFNRVSPAHAIGVYELHGGFRTAGRHRVRTARKDWNDMDGVTSK